MTCGGHPDVVVSRFGLLSVLAELGAVERAELASALCVFCDATGSAYAADLRPLSL